STSVTVGPETWTSWPASAPGPAAEVRVAELGDPESKTSTCFAISGRRGARARASGTGVSPRGTWTDTQHRRIYSDIWHRAHIPVALRDLGEYRPSSPQPGFRCSGGCYELSVVDDHYSQPCLDGYLARDVDGLHRGDTDRERDREGRHHQRRRELGDVPDQR